MSDIEAFLHDEALGSSVINDLVAHGVLVEMTGQQRNRLLSFREYLDLFR